VITVYTSVAEPHHVDAAPGKNFDAVPAPAQTVQTNVEIICSYDYVRFILLNKMGYKL
jgi:hypothetical protein